MFNIGDIVEGLVKNAIGKPNFVLQIVDIQTVSYGSQSWKECGYRHIDNPKDVEIYKIDHKWLWENARKRAPKRSVKHYFEGT